jgi:DNA-directed RNA polymerase specialized sigma24 family protein
VEQGTVLRLFLERAVMQIGQLANVARERLERFVQTQCTSIPDGPTADAIKQLQDAAAHRLQTVLARNPATDPVASMVWAANAVRIGLEDVLDELAERYPPENATHKKAQRELLRWRAGHRAFAALGEPERTVGLLIEYFGLPLDRCAELLRANDVAGAVQRALRQAADAGTFEEHVLTEALSIYVSTWKPVYGAIPDNVIALVRDAVRLRLTERGRLPEHITLRAYSLTFGDLFRTPRRLACLSALNRNTDEVKTRKAKDALGLYEAAKRAFIRLRDLSRARRELRRAAAFVVGQEPVADDWYALVHDAGLTYDEAALIVNVPAPGVESLIERYQQAIDEWVEAHPMPPN